MARCQIALAVLCVLPLCFSYQYGGYQDPRLIPQPVQSQGFYENPYPQYPQYNPYWSYSQAAPQGQYPEYDGALLEEDELAASTAPAAAPVTTSAAPAGTSTAPSSDSASVQTPDQTSNGADSTAAASANSNMDALDAQLAAALDAVKADMISKGKEILEEKQWTDDVKNVIQQYQHKISNVYTNIEKLKVDMGNLYKKKQQIINAQLQKSLNAKLGDAKQDLATVTTALEKVENTQAEFAQSKQDIQDTINSIYTQLAELKGQSAASASGAAAGGASAGAGGGASAASDNSSQGGI